MDRGQNLIPSSLFCTIPTVAFSFYGLRSRDAGLGFGVEGLDLGLKVSRVMDLEFGA